MNKLASIIQRRWTLVLLLLSIILFAANALIFYPGYMSADSLAQYQQALGGKPLGDWHPPVMVLVWKLLLIKPPLMLAFQLGMLWLALTILAIFLYRKTQSKKISLLPFALAFLPFILNISGIIWKDVQMTYALLLSVVLLIVMRYIQSRPWKYATYGLVFALITYACLLRYNAIAAVLPIIYLALYQLGWVRSARYRVLITLALCGVILLTGSLLNTIMGVKKDHPVSAIMLDDITNVQSSEKLSGMPGPLRNDLLEVQRQCVEKNVVMNSYWICANDMQRGNIHSTYYYQLSKYWIKTIVTNPVKYATYRIETMSLFFFAPEGYSYIWHPGIDQNDLGLDVKSERIGHATEVYVKDFGYMHFPFLYQAWFWILANVIILLSIGRFKQYSTYIMALTISSIAYIIGYFPMVVAVDYRYIYWSVIATVVAVLLIVVDMQRKNNHKLPIL